MYHVPLIAPHHLSSMSPKTFRDYIKQLRDDFVSEQAKLKAERAGPPKSPIKGVNYRVNDKGTPIITIRNRKPKWLSPSEIDKMAEFYEVPKNEMWKTVIDKGIEVRR